MQDAKRLAQGCEATDNARGIRGHAAPDTFCHLECQIRDFLRFLLIFSTYDSSKVNYILHNNILNFHLWIYNEFILGGGGYKDFQDSFSIIKMDMVVVL